MPGYRPAEHHHLIASKLEGVARGSIKRLMIFMPPRHGKSELASRRFPAFVLGDNPSRQFIGASYGADLAGDFGRDVRNIVRSPEFGILYPEVELAEDSKAAGRWHTNAGGGYVAAGVGTAVTGRGANILLVDDPVKDREAADSQAIMEKTYRWYLSTAYTRLESELKEDENPDPLWSNMDDVREAGAEPFEGAIVLIQTRWSDGDLAGRLLTDMEDGADQWEILSLPALGEDGTPLWPEKYDAAALGRIKAALTGREWNALYQQNPTPEEGSFFQRSWFETWDTKPEACHIYMTGDFAVTDDGGDYTEIGVWAVDENEVIHQIDWYKAQASALAWIDAFLDLVDKWKPLCFFGEGGPIRRAIEPILRREMVSRKTFCRLEWLPSITDKPSRARGFQARAEAGQVRLMRGHHGKELLEQLVAFPAGTHDDGVDTCSLIGQALDKVWPGVVKAKAKTPPKEMGFYGAEDGTIKSNYSINDFIKRAEKKRKERRR